MDEAESSPAQVRSKRGSRSADPGLKRADSPPARLPSHALQRTEVRPVRKPITRPLPDTKPPRDFAKPPLEIQRLLGIALPFQTQMRKSAEIRRIKDGAKEKVAYLVHASENLDYFKWELHTKPEYLEALKDRHPKFNGYSQYLKYKSIDPLYNHPGFRAEMAKAQTEISLIPSGPTRTRMMTKGEQNFLTHAFRQLNEEIQKHPFHMHGETAMVGNKRGRVTQFDYFPGDESASTLSKGDKYHLHTHPPLLEPFSSSASGADHRVAAELYREYEMTTYVTNGKDVLHIQPHSTELVKLTPDPELEKTLGKFPEGYRLPDPQRPPHPFSNHEAPAAYKGKHSVSLKTLFTGTAKEDGKRKSNIGA